MKRLALIAVLALTACGPTYRTNYNLLPPAGKEGQICTNAVKSMSGTCVANCQQMSRSCRNFTPGLGVSYGRNYGGNFEPVHGSSILDERDCSASQCEASCLAAARTNHIACGGTVTMQTVCTANCPQPGAPLPPPPAPPAK